MNRDESIILRELSGAVTVLKRAHYCSFCPLRARQGVWKAGVMKK
jgi:hypothetical protein